MITFTKEVFSMADNISADNLFMLRVSSVNTSVTRIFYATLRRLKEVGSSSDIEVGRWLFMIQVLECGLYCFCFL